jgi:hypothetical protein
MHRFVLLMIVEERSAGEGVSSQCRPSRSCGSRRLHLVEAPLCSEQISHVMAQASSDVNSCSEDRMRLLTSTKSDWRTLGAGCCVPASMRSIDDPLAKRLSQGDNLTRGSESRARHESSPVASLRISSELTTTTTITLQQLHIHHQICQT